jgi:Rap1a immunity proteins
VSTAELLGPLIVATLAIALGSTSAKAASANEVLPACKLYLSVVDRHGAVSQSAVSHLMDAGECLGAIYAMLNVSQALTVPLRFCPPTDTQPDQGARVVIAYIEKKPERGREDFTTIALDALRSKWPC